VVSDPYREKLINSDPDILMNRCTPMMDLKNKFFILGLVLVITGPILGIGAISATTLDAGEIQEQWSKKNLRFKELSSGEHYTIRATVESWDTYNQLVLREGNRTIDYHLGQVVLVYFVGGNTPIAVKDPTFFQAATEEDPDVIWQGQVLTINVKLESINASITEDRNTYYREVQILLSRNGMDDATRTAPWEAMLFSLSVIGVLLLLYFFIMPRIKIFKKKPKDEIRSYRLRAIYMLLFAVVGSLVLLNVSYLAVTQVWAREWLSWSVPVDALTEVMVHPVRYIYWISPFLWIPAVYWLYNDKFPVEWKGKGWRKVGLGLGIIATAMAIVLFPLTLRLIGPNNDAPGDLWYNIREFTAGMIGMFLVNGIFITLLTMYLYAMTPVFKFKRYLLLGLAILTFVVMAWLKLLDSSSKVGADLDTNYAVSYLLAHLMWGIFIVLLIMVARYHWPDRELVPVEIQREPRPSGHGKSTGPLAFPHKIRAPKKERGQASRDYYED
jgi:hypothetical protein